MHNAALATNPDLEALFLHHHAQQRVQRQAPQNAEAQSRRLGRGPQGRLPLAGGHRVHDGRRHPHRKRQLSSRLRICARRAARQALQHPSHAGGPGQLRGPPVLAKLNRGEFHFDECKRIAKGGREVWIQATYNPVFNEEGKPYKVVKFATDATRQVSQRLQAEKAELEKKRLPSTCRPRSMYC